MQTIKQTCSECGHVGNVQITCKAFACAVCTRIQSTRIEVLLQDGNSGGEYGYFLSKLAYAWESGNPQTLADLCRYFEQKQAVVNV